MKDVIYFDLPSYGKCVVEKQSVKYLVFLIEVRICDIPKEDGLAY
jgi:hypothetical protein